MSSLEATLLIIWVVPVLAILVFSIRAFARPTIQNSVTYSVITSAENIKSRVPLFEIDWNDRPDSQYVLLIEPTVTSGTYGVATLFLN